MHLTFDQVMRNFLLFKFKKKMTCSGRYTKFIYGVIYGVM